MPGLILLFVVDNLVEEDTAVEPAPAPEPEPEPEPETEPVPAVGIEADKEVEEVPDRKSVV